jgi:exosome complex component RRP43
MLLGDNDHGWVVPNVELSPLAGAKYKIGPPGSSAQVLDHRLAKLLETTSLVSLESLVIEKGAVAWVLYADILCLNDDGNLFDACWASMVEALRRVELPEVEWDGANEKAVYIGKGRTVECNERPYSFTFALFNDQVLADPDELEGEECTDTITIVVNEDNKVRCISGDSGTALQECISLAKAQYEIVQQAADPN